MPSIAQTRFPILTASASKHEVMGGHVAQISAYPLGICKVCLLTAQDTTILSMVRKTPASADHVVLLLHKWWQRFV
jgi:hypothetical protein